MSALEALKNVIENEKIDDCKIGSNEMPLWHDSWDEVEKRKKLAPQKIAALEELSNILTKEEGDALAREIRENKSRKILS